MTYVEKIYYLIERFELTPLQLSAMLGISRAKIKKIINNEKEVSKKEEIRIDRAIKVQQMINKHVALDKEVKDQEFILENLKNKKIDFEVIEGIIAEAMYLGLMLANKNEDEYVLRKVRAWRK